MIQTLVHAAEVYSLFGVIYFAVCVFLFGLLLWIRPRNIPAREVAIIAAFVVPALLVLAVMLTIVILDLAFGAPERFKAWCNRHGRGAL